MSKIKKHKITIIGSGLVGMTLALKIASQGIKVVLIDKVSDNHLLNIKDSRTSAISQGSARILSELGLWEQIKKECQPILDIIVTEGLSNNKIFFQSSELDEGPLGYIVNNKFLKEFIYRNVKKSKNIQFIQNSTLKKIKSNPFYVELTTNKARIHTSLVIGADGRFSNTRSLANFKYFYHDYRQCAYVFNICHKREHQSKALERFFPSGPLAILPMKKKKSKNLSSVVWTIKNFNSNSQRIFEQNFKQEFMNKYGDFFGSVLKIENPAKYNLNVFSCYEPFKNRVVLVGDANQAIHPIAGQGLNLGFRDSKILSDVIIEAQSLGFDIGSEIVLNKYLRKRYIDKNLLFQATHSLNDLFSSENLFLQNIRKAGLRLFNRSALLKKQSMMFAMGLRNFEI